MATGGTTTRKTDTFGKSLWPIASYTGLSLISETIRALPLISWADCLVMCPRAMLGGLKSIPHSLPHAVMKTQHSIDRGDHDAARGYTGTTTQMQRSDHQRG